MNELKHIERTVARLNRDIEKLWWKCAFGLGDPDDYAKMSALREQVNTELTKRGVLIENLRGEEAILKENGQ